MTFEEYCASRGIDQVKAWKDCQTVLDLVPQPRWDAVCTGPSRIHGRGVYARRPLKRGDRVGMLLTPELFRTDIIGRFINHESPSNTHVEVDPATGCRFLVAACDIGPVDEVTLDYADLNGLRDQHWLDSPVQRLKL